MDSNGDMIGEAQLVFVKCINSPRVTDTCVYWKRVKHYIVDLHYYYA